MSTTVLPSVRPAAMPCCANSADSTSGVSGTMMKTMSERSATSRPFRQGTAVVSAISPGNLPSVCT